MTKERLIKNDIKYESITDVEAALFTFFGQLEAEEQTENISHIITL